MELINEFQKDPSKFDGTPLKELLMERKNHADKERKLAGEIIEYQRKLKKK